MTEAHEYSVSEISQHLKSVIEGNFSFVRVRGEFSKITVAKSGHMYASLKDAEAVIDVVCWKGSLSRIAFKLEEGMEVICSGRITTYPGRSNYQLVAENIELAGEGALLKMLDERKKKLAAEGLFDISRKKALPFIPKSIGVITSPTGAVIRDIMHRLNERFPRKVYLYPVLVQGNEAAAQVTESLERFNSLSEGSEFRPDVIIIARGGGSVEDLMPFNDEKLVRAVAASKIPVISAVGHETDTTLIDYAADLRAPTPTAAAEKAVPVLSELAIGIASAQNRMISAITRLLKLKKTQVEAMRRGVINPERLLDFSRQRLDNVATRFEGALGLWLERKRSKLDNLSSILQAYSFERVLERGYAVVLDEKNALVSSVSQTSLGQKLKIRFKDGEISTKIN